MNSRLCTNYRLAVWLNEEHMSPLHSHSRVVRDYSKVIKLIITPAQHTHTHRHDDEGDARVATTNDDEK